MNSAGEWHYQFSLDLLDSSSQESITVHTVDELVKALLRFWDYRTRWLTGQSSEE